MRNDRSGRTFLPERTFAKIRTVGWTFLSVVWPVSSINAQDVPHQHVLVRGVFRGEDLGHECPGYMECGQDLTVRDDMEADDEGSLLRSPDHANLADYRVGNCRRGCDKARREESSTSGSCAVDAGPDQVCDTAVVGTFAGCFQPTAGTAHAMIRTGAT